MASSQNDINTFSAAYKAAVPPKPKREMPAKPARPPLTRANLKVGARVEGNFWGKGRWYPGVITHLTHEQPKESEKRKKDKSKDKGGKEQGKGGKEETDIPDTLRVTIRVSARVESPR